MSKPTNNIYLIESDKLILVYKEVKSPEKNQINTYFDYVEELVKGRKFHLIIDLSDCKHPSAKVRDEIKNKYKDIAHLIESYSVYIGNNRLLRIAIRFIGPSIGIKSYKKYDTIPEAINHIHNL
jgi:hypothetical protein